MEELVRISDALICTLCRTAGRSRRSPRKIRTIPCIVRAAWGGYFTLMRDYRIDVREIYCQNDRVVLIGEASGTYVPEGRLDQDNRWRVPAAWRARAAGNRIVLWQVFVNPGPILEIIRRTVGSGPDSG